MTARLHALTFDANDPVGLARFWGEVLGWESVDGGLTLLPDDEPGVRLRFVATEEKKVGQGRIHFDLTSASDDAMQQTVARALELGGQHIDIGQTPDDGHVVLADPEGNEFCVIEPGNNFLADTGFIGAINCDGSQQVGYFWSEALGWPLVWDQDEETAIQSPRGGSKVTWSGPPLMPRHGRDRMRFELVADGDQRAEVDRLVALGAARGADVGDGSVAMTDPDGNEFAVIAAP
ncbi:MULTISPECIES: VOC family protein [unclassified Nocardioides]|uniref:VOC family protein n=1 Tax=unclassified Nocardioides TaxID=2615069 RepID=UPI0006FD16A2|nr:MULTISPECIES: VOC family protein [unclassified Nocardioides]KQY55576.1 bleomycin resistance protein [Nocardioides sp. Root140]KRF12687.1 bleomycin resistance protein [Nocardioides sp. Soil796]